MLCFNNLLRQLLLAAASGTQSSQGRRRGKCQKSSSQRGKQPQRKVIPLDGNIGKGAHQGFPFQSARLQNMNLLGQRRNVPWAQPVALDIFVGNETIRSAVSFSGLSWPRWSGVPPSLWLPDNHKVFFKSLHNLSAFFSMPQLLPLSLVQENWRTLSVLNTEVHFVSSNVFGKCRTTKSKAANTEICICKFNIHM